MILLVPVDRTLGKMDADRMKREMERQLTGYTVVLVGGMGGRAVAIPDLTPAPEHPQLPFEGNEGEQTKTEQTLFGRPLTNPEGN